MQATSTTTVPWITWFWPGHSTFFSSAQDSKMKFERPRRLAPAAAGRQRGDGGCARCAARRSDPSSDI